MKVLFAVNNESISESIIKKYQQEYKEIISSKNVYYFDAITRELQKDKSYDRIVISEDVEPFANNNYGVIDKFIFERLDSISDEATSNNGQDIPIILICADRRTKSENFFVKIFGIGIYSALIGQDRTISKVCELINKPRNKKDAKVYYRIDTDDVDYKAEGEGDVNEVEIQNILNHYKRLGKNEEEYVKSFDNIAEQYTDAQLKVICRFLPLNVKAVLEASSPKYQELITFGTVTPNTTQLGGKKYVPNKEYQDTKKASKNTSSSKLEIIEKNIGKSELTKPVVIPSVAGVKSQKQTSEAESGDSFTQQVAQTQKMQQTISQMSEQATSQSLAHTTQQANTAQNADLNQDEIENILQSVESNISEQTVEPPKRRRGRPKKNPEGVQAPQTAQTQNAQSLQTSAEEQPKRRRGRPRKVDVVAKEATDENSEVRSENETVDLFNLGANDEENNGGLILPGLDDEQTIEVQPEEKAEIDLFNLGDSTVESNNGLAADINNVNNTTIQNQYNFQNTGFSTAPNTQEVERTHVYNPNEDASFKNLLSMSNKLVAFVGTSKNGTSFLVNSMAENLSRKGIKTAILDLTQNKNAYYIYTQNDESLRKIAFSCIENLENGIDKGIEVNKNLTVFTTLPDKNAGYVNYKKVIETLNKNYSLVIMDCDYETGYAYFNFAQEIYLVQSYDILTIQPLTAFLRNLKANNILDPNKLRIVLNKVLRVRSISDRVIIGGMSSYNDPSMSYMTELFDKDNVQYCTIPFDQEVYSKYLDGLVNCEISTKGYPKNFNASLEKLANMIYPLLNNDRPANKFNAFNQQTNGFSSNMNATLNKMKNRY